MERYQLIIFATVVIALLILGFFFGRWLRGLLPSASGIFDALRSAWDRFVAWISRPFNPLRGTVGASNAGGADESGIYSGERNANGTLISDCVENGLPPDCVFLDVSGPEYAA